MKQFLVVIGLIVAVSCNSQKLRLDNGCWMPKQFIESFTKNPNGNYAQLVKPVHVFKMENDSLYIKTFGSEFNYCELNVVGQERYQIVDFAKFINLKYFQREEFRDCKAFLTKRKDDLLILEISKPSGSQYFEFNPLLKSNVLTCEP